MATGLVLLDYTSILLVASPEVPEVSYLGS